MIILQFHMPYTVIWQYSSYIFTLHKIPVWHVLAFEFNWICWVVFSSRNGCFNREWKEKQYIQKVCYVYILFVGILSIEIFSLLQHKDTNQELHQSHAHEITPQINVLMFMYNFILDGLLLDELTFDIGLTFQLCTYKLQVIRL